MSAPSLYSVTSREVSPVADLLKAVVEVNWWLAQAGEQGWSVTLDVAAETGQLCIKVERDECWPTLSAEIEAQEAEA